jgi:hypothetical protein
MLLCLILLTLAALFYIIATVFREPNPAATGDDSGRGEKAEGGTGAAKDSSSAGSGGGGAGFFGGFFSQEKRDKAIAKGVAAGALTAGQAMFASDADTTTASSAKAPKADSKAGMVRRGASSSWAGTSACCLNATRSHLISWCLPAVLRWLPLPGQQRWQVRRLQRRPPGSEPVPRVKLMGQRVANPGVQLVVHVSVPCLCSGTKPRWQLCRYCAMCMTVLIMSSGRDLLRRLNAHRLSFGPLRRLTVQLCRSARVPY